MAVKPIKVTQLNNYIGRVLKTDPILGGLAVIGEISNLKYHNSGHVYFTLKDEGSRINCFMADRVASSLRYELTDGMEIIVSGYISVYEKGGYYSLNVRSVEVSGQGNLAAAYRAMYDRLLKEGLFDQKYKKPLPVFPEKVCVVTSPTGAAVRDILKIIKSRNNLVNVLIYPCLVQGDHAAGDIAAAIEAVNLKFPDTDLIIVGRGGGSLEELWAFNEEKVARSIFASLIPVISAVGHETDFSISDYVADRRAETPTAAAVMAVPDTFQLMEDADNIMENTSTRLKRIMNLKKESLKRFSGQMLSAFFVHRVEKHRTDTEKHIDDLRKGMQKKMGDLKAGLENCMIRLEAGSPDNIIKRGYAVIRDSENGQILTDTGKLAEGKIINVVMRNGSVQAEVKHLDPGLSGTDLLKNTIE